MRISSVCLILAFAFLYTSWGSSALAESSVTLPAGTAAPFVLEKGAGLGVCAAYLELLNKTTFDRTPFCGRPENGSVERFTTPERHYLDGQEILALYRNVYEFMGHGNQYYLQNFFDSRTDSWNPNPVSLFSVQEMLGRGWMRVWTYIQPMDIENVGRPLNVLIWQGIGATDTGTICGADRDDRHPWDNNYNDQRAFILASDGKSIDEEKTREIFGRDPNTSKDTSHVRRQLAVAHGFSPLADTIGIFAFDGHNYIQVENKPRSLGADLPPVRVLLRENGHTREVCSIVPKNVPHPE